MLRISLILAILAGLAAGVVNIVMVKEKITTLQTNYKNEQDAHTKTKGELSQTKRELDTTKKELATTQENLKTTTEEKDKAVQEADAAKKKADGLAADLDKTKKERDSAQQDLAAYKATGWTPERILAADKEFKGLKAQFDGATEENLVLGKKLKKTQEELAFYVHPEHHIQLPADLKGKVLLPDPKWGFVILDVGDDKEVIEKAELLVHRGGTLVAKVMVTKVDKDRCVANVVPGWGRGEDILEGDTVIPAYPRTL